MSKNQIYLAQYDYKIKHNFTITSDSWANANKVVTNLMHSENFSEYFHNSDSNFSEDIKILSSFDSAKVGDYLRIKTSDYLDPNAIKFLLNDKATYRDLKNFFKWDSK